MTVSEIEPGRLFYVEKVNLTKELGKRLADMGFTKGTQGMVMRRSLFGGPLHIRILGYELAIRSSEACGITIAELEN